MESRKGKETREKEIGLAKRGAMMNEKIVSIRLKQLREKTGLSQAKLAKVLGGVSQPVIARYEAGDCFPSYSVLIKIADYFNVSTDYLLGRTPAGKLCAQVELGEKVDDFIEMCFDPTTQANARLKEMLRKIMEGNKEE